MLFLILQKLIFDEKKKMNGGNWGIPLIVLTCNRQSFEVLLQAEADVGDSSA